MEALWEAESFLSLIEWNGEPTKKEKHSEANKKLVELYRYFDKNRIYIPKEICSSLDSLVKNVRSQVIKFGVWVGYENNQLTDDSHKQKNADWNSGWNAIKNEIPAARERLESEFRILLGASTGFEIKTAPETTDHQ